MKVADVTVDVIVYLPDDITVIIVCLDGTADVVADDAVMLVTNYLGCRDIAVTVVNTCDEVFNRFWSVECDLTSLGNNRVRTVSLGIVPLVQDDTFPAAPRGTDTSIRPETAHWPAAYRTPRAVLPAQRDECHQTFLIQNS